MSESDEISEFIPPAIEELTQWLPRYEFLDLIACGGMGAVYRARQISLDRMVAIKILPPELAVNETFRQSFEAEGKAMAKLSHSNLVGVYDFGEISNMLYLAIEFVEGSNLYDSKGESAIDPETAITLIRSVSAGLAEAHRAGMVHRDIKPANVLINTDLVPKLGDFGLAVPNSDIESGLMMGTPAYLAPEVEADPTSASFASDTYALGVILYEMLTGRSIEHGDEMDLSIVPALGDLPTIVRKSVDPNPLLRYQNGEDIENALNDWLSKPKNSGLVVNGGGASMLRSMNPVGSANSSGIGGGFLVSLVLLAIVGGLAWVWFEQSVDDSSEEMTADSTSFEDDSQASLGDVDKVQTLEGFRAKQKAALQELSRKTMGQRSANRRRFLEVAGEEGEALLKLSSNDQDGIPRYFFESEVKMSKKLLRHLEEFGSTRQGGIDQKFREEITSLHGESVRDLRSLEIELPKGVATRWERWAEWLEESPRNVMHVPMVGRWHLSPSSDPFELHVSSTGKKILVIGEKRLGRVNLIELDQRDRFSLECPGNTVSGFPWKLRWQDDQLIGLDAQGEIRKLELEDFDYADLLKDKKRASERKGQASEDEAGLLTFTDPEVATLTENYRKALITKIEPLESGYVRVLEEFKKTQVKADIALIEEELRRVNDLNWREGFLKSAGIPVPAGLPKLVSEKHAVFRSEFEKRYDPIQQTYLQALKKMKSTGKVDLSDVNQAIKLLEMPAGVVEARFVKLVSLGDGEMIHTAISMMEVLDQEGESLSFHEFTKIKVSSAALNSKGEKVAGALALDGNPRTHWRSKWGNHVTGEGFPHWISFDLGEKHLISGFSVTPRGARQVQKAGITNWAFYVSLDRKRWTAVGKGKFPANQGKKIYRGFQKVRAGTE